MIGDIAGSKYEFNNTFDYDFEMFGEGCDFTDDTICTVAIADAILNGRNYQESLLDWCRRYPSPKGAYGGRFAQWIRSLDPEPYNSFGNGSAMRVSPCAWVMNCGFCARTGMWTSRDLARLSASVTHNHPEGIKGALAVCDAIIMARFYFRGWNIEYSDPIDSDPDECKSRIKEHIEEEYGYDLSVSLDSIRKDYEFDETCQGSVPQAIIALLESTDFEDAIRNAISIGGDSDTIAAITGSIAEAAYGIPDDIKEKADAYLDEPLKDVLRRWKKYMRGEKV